MGNINLTMLIRQKLVLLRVMSTLNTKDEEFLQGVLNLLDHIHDQGPAEIQQTLTLMGHALSS
jgi:hypothetical protein